MQTVKWIGFGASNALSRTFAHFFPASDNVSAPYPANCKLTVFSKNVAPRSVVLEGGRLGHPDGLRLDDAFPGLKDQAMGLFGLEVELSCSQPRLDLRSSCCVIEVFSQGIHSRFWPQQCREGGSYEQNQSRPLPKISEPLETIKASPKSSTKHGIAIKDSLQLSSLVVVNSGSRAGRVTVDTMAKKSPQAETVLSPIDVAPFSLEEIVIDEKIWAATAPHEYSWGTQRASMLECSIHPAPVQTEATDQENEKTDTVEGFDDAMAFYMVHRDGVSRRITSVVSLS